MENNYINKMQKTAAVLSKSLIVVNSIIFIYISTLFMVFINDCIEIYHGSFSSVASMITFNEIILPHESILMMAEKMYPAVMSVKLFMIIEVIVVFISIVILCNILRCVTEARPFDGTVSRNLGKMGKIILAVGLLSPVAEFCTEKIIWNVYKPLLSSIVPQMDGFNIFASGVNVNFIIIFFGATMLLLGYIFRYGEELQKLSDETL